MVTWNRIMDSLLAWLVALSLQVCTEGTRARIQVQDGDVAIPRSRLSSRSVLKASPNETRGSSLLQARGILAPHSVAPPEKKLSTKKRGRHGPSHSNHRRLSTMPMNPSIRNRLKAYSDPRAGEQKKNGPTRWAGMTHVVSLLGFPGGR